MRPMLQVLTHACWGLCLTCIFFQTKPDFFPFLANCRTSKFLQVPIFFGLVFFSSFPSTGVWYFQVDLYHISVSKAMAEGDSSIEVQNSLPVSKICFTLMLYLSRIMKIECSLHKRNFSKSNMAFVLREFSMI